MRTCNKCKKTKEENGFFKCKRSGYQYHCKDCQRIMDSKRRPYRKQYMKNYMKERSKTYNLKRNFGENGLKALERDNFKCVKCGMTNEEHIKTFRRRITIDHIDGFGRNSKTKNNDTSNLQTLCLVCHGKKDIKRRVWRKSKS